MNEHYINFPSDHLNCEYIGINAYATDNWEIEITLDGQYHLQDLEKIVAYVKTLNVKKASEKATCNKCNDTGWVCEWHPDKEAHKCCGGAGMPCECIGSEK